MNWSKKKRKNWIEWKHGTKNSWKDVCGCVNRKQAKVACSLFSVHWFYLMVRHKTQKPFINTQNLYIYTSMGCTLLGLRTEDRIKKAISFFLFFLFSNQIFSFHSFGGIRMEVCWNGEWLLCMIFMNLECDSFFSPHLSCCSREKLPIFEKMFVGEKNWMENVKRWFFGEFFFYSLSLTECFQRAKLDAR